MPECNGTVLPDTQGKNMCAKNFVSSQAFFQISRLQENTVKYARFQVHESFLSTLEDELI